MKEFMENNFDSNSNYFKKRCIEMEKKLLMPSFRYGLNIDIGPEEFQIDKMRVNNKLSKFKINDKSYLKEEKDFSDLKLIKIFSKDFDEFNTKIDYFFIPFSKFYFIDVPKNSENNLNIEIGGAEKSDCSMVIFLLIGENSKSKILFKQGGKISNFYLNVRIICEKNSQLDFYSLQSMEGRIFSKRIYACDENSNVKFFDFCSKASYILCDTIGFLNGENSKSNQLLFFNSKKKQKFNFFNSLIHNSKHTYSNILTKGVSDDESQVLARGLVDIKKDSSNSDGYEKHDFLVLSKNSKVYTIPTLEIKNNEVKCTHGATVGNLDIEQIFYLMSRGLDYESAKKKIIEGYFGDSVKYFPDTIKIF